MFGVMCRLPKWTHSPCSSTLLYLFTVQNTLCTAIPVFISLRARVASSHYRQLYSPLPHWKRLTSCLSHICTQLLVNSTVWPKWGFDRFRSDIHSWGVFKKTTPPRNIQELKCRIQEERFLIPVQMMCYVRTNFANDWRDSRRNSRYHYDVNFRIWKFTLSFIVASALLV